MDEEEEEEQGEKEKEERTVTIREPLSEVWEKCIWEIQTARNNRTISIL